MLGDSVEAALKQLGITQERVERWLGSPCGCPERILKLNQLGAWSTRILKGRLEQAQDYLNEILEQK